MLEQIDQLTQSVSNIIIYSNSAILQNVLNKKLKEVYKIERYATKYANDSATLKVAKNETYTPPFSSDMWYVDINCDKIPIKELEKALNSVSFAAVNVYWVSNYATYKKLIDSEIVKKQGVFCCKLYTGRVAPEDISYIQNLMLPEEKRLPKRLLDYLKKNYTYDVSSVCELFDKIMQDEEVVTTEDIIELVGIGGNTVDSFVMKLLTSNPKTEKGLKKAVEHSLVLLNDLSYTYNYNSLRNFIRNAVNNILEIKQLQVMGRYTTVRKEIPETGFNEKGISRYRRFERSILEEINIARVLKLKMIMEKYDTFYPDLDLLQVVYTFLSEITQSNINNPESKEFSGKRRRRKL